MPATTSSPLARRIRRRAALLALPALAAALVAGCGSDDDTQDPGTKAADGGGITVAGTEYAFDPAKVTADAGKVKITLENKGKIDHELELLKTDKADDALKVSGGRVEDPPGVEGEIEPIEPGESESKTFDLKSGHYVYICNIPGHYPGGMHGTLTVR